MDINWYTFDTIVHEVRHARRANAHVERLAAIARRHRARRRIGTLLITLGHTLVAASSSPVSEGAARRELAR
jgi:hypothetical protein